MAGIAPMIITWQRKCNMNDMESVIMLGFLDFIKIPARPQVPHALPNIVLQLVKVMQDFRAMSKVEDPSPQTLRHPPYASIRR